MPSLGTNGITANAGVLEDVRPDKLKGYSSGPQLGNAMRKFASYALCFAACGLLSVAPPAEAAAANGAGPYYATPSWDQTLPPTTRFIVLSNFNNEAFLDRETGLVWARRVLNPSLQKFAVTDCMQMKAGDRYGWRLPTVDELSSVWEPTKAYATLFDASAGFSMLWTSIPSESGFFSVEFSGSFDPDLLQIFVSGSLVENRSVCVRGGSK